VTLRAVTQHSFIQNMINLVSGEEGVTEVVKLVSWFLLDTTDLYKEMRMWVKR
jgi:hypothetical protein